MKAKVRTTQELVNVKLIDASGNVLTWEDEQGHGYLDHELDFEDLTNYKAWVENLIHDLAVKEFSVDRPMSELKAYPEKIVFFAYSVLDKMMFEAKTWR